MDHLDLFLPFHGDVAMFKATVNSVLNQDNSAWRLTIVNDAHPDTSVDEWVRELNLPNISYFRNEINLGPSRNFTRCIEFATSSHCVFLGADDLLHPNFVSVVIRELSTNPGILLIQPGVSVVDEFGAIGRGLVDRVKNMLSRMGGYGFVRPKRMIASLMVGSWLYFPSLIWRVDKVREFGFNEKYNVCADLDLALKVLATPGRILVLRDVIFSYRRHSTSDSSTKLLSGERFDEERRLHYFWSAFFFRNRNLILSLLAALHISSRLHALVMLPRTLRTKEAFLRTIRHILF